MLMEHCKHNSFIIPTKWPVLSANLLLLYPTLFGVFFLLILIIFQETVSLKCLFMFSVPFVPVCLSAGLTKNYWTNVPETWWKGGAWAKKEPIRSWHGSTHYPGNIAWMSSCWALANALLFSSADEIDYRSKWFSSAGTHKTLFITLIMTSVFLLSDDKSTDLT